MTENGSVGFEGGMTSRKHISITKTSKVTATRVFKNFTNRVFLLLMVRVDR
jgi:Fic family protein